MMAHAPSSDSDTESIQENLFQATDVKKEQSLSVFLDNQTKNDIVVIEKPQEIVEVVLEDLELEPQTKDEDT